jgi:hypothetical protein
LSNLLNGEAGSLNNTFTCNTNLEVENETDASSSRICNMFNVTFFETVYKPLLDKNLMHSQTINNTISQKDSFVLLEITETELTNVVHRLKNKKSAGFAC